MPQFDIEMTRIGTGNTTITVQAANQIEAEELALDEAGNHLYNEKASEYELSDGRTGERAGLARFGTFTDADLVEELRARGAAICVFVADDIVDCGRAKTLDDAKVLLLDVRSKFEDQMTGHGWDIIDSMPGKPPEENEATFLLVVESDLYGDVISYKRPELNQPIDAYGIDPRKLFHAFVDRIDVFQDPASANQFFGNGDLLYETHEWLRGRGFDFDSGLMITLSDGTPTTVKVLVQAPASALLASDAPAIDLPDSDVPPPARQRS